MSRGKVVIGAASGTLEHGSGSVTLDLERLVKTRLLIQANSGGGKSWALRRILEQTHGRLQHLVIDPEGEFATLRERFDYVLAARTGGDTLAEPRAAKLLAERLLELNVSAILDIYELKAHERVRFVRAFLEALVDAPKKLWHPALVVVDEAHVYCPEKGEAESAGAVIDLCTRGRKRGFCAVLATQRLAKLHKDAAAECNNKLVGRAAIDVDLKRAADDLGFGKDRWQDLRQLPEGDFFAFGPAISDAVLQVHVGAVQTRHQSGGTMSSTPPAPSAAVKALLPKLADLPAEAERERATNATLQHEVADLKRRLAAAVKDIPMTPAPKASTARIRKAMESAMKFIVSISAAKFDVAGLDRSELENALKSAVEGVTRSIEKRLDARAQQILALQARAEATLAALHAALKDEDIQVSVEVTKNDPFTVAPRTPPRANTERGRVASGLRPNEALALPTGERAVLVAAAQRPDGVGRDQLSVLTGYKRSSRDAYISRLAASGLVVVRGALVVATDTGVAALGPNFDPLPTGEALRDYWLERLPQGEAAVLRCVLSEHPDPVPRARIDEVTGYKRSSRDAYISRLVARRVVETQGSAVAAARELFA